MTTYSSVSPLSRSRWFITFVLSIVLILNQQLDYIMPSEDTHHNQKLSPTTKTATTRLQKRSPPIFVPLNQVHFPQQQQQEQQEQQKQQHLRPARPGVPPRWTSHSINEPANIPSPLSQDDARYLEQYMKNDFPNSNGNYLNLASTNHRTNKPVGRKMSETGPSSNQKQTASQRLSPNENKPSQRSDFGYPVTAAVAEYEHAPHGGRKGKVDDIIITKQPSDPRRGYVQPASSPKQNLFHSILHPVPVLNKFQENCITRSVQQAGMCEDHLIKRLTQDATEGRTVVDVGRRVCCALFWHKECIDSIVLKACPDSTPVAADYILGARKIDLATSCQRFNREGCNGSSKISSALSRTLPVVSAILVLLLCM